jgi:hypothetical protein
MRLDFFRLTDRQQLDECAVELHDAIMRAPGMLVARADGEAEAHVSFRRSIEIVDGMDNVIEAAGQELNQPALVDGRTDEGREKRMRFEWPRFQFGMELHADEPGMVLVFDDLRQNAVGRHA